jgi:hypothetical protein
VALATVEHQQVKAALGEKELVGRVHNFLATKVPHVEFDVFGVVQAKGPLGNLNALGFCRFGVEPFVDEPIHQRGFTHGSKTHQNQLGFIQGGTLCQQSKIVVENILWISRFSFPLLTCSQVGPKISSGKPNKDFWR